MSRDQSPRRHHPTGQRRARRHRPRAALLELGLKKQPPFNLDECANECAILGKAKLSYSVAITAEKHPMEGS
jgi:hypothetical protein